MKYGSKEYGSIFKDFQKNRNWLNGVDIEIVGGENELDPLTLLRAYDEEPTVDSTMNLTTQMVMNRQVRFTRGNETILEVFIKPGDDVAGHFAKVPYLLDMLMKLCYGLMVKKLTPPSEDSGKEERQ